MTAPTSGDCLDQRRNVIRSPEISIAVPAAGSRLRQGQVVLADYACTDEDGPADVMGCAGQLKPGDEHAPVGGRFERSYRYTVVDTIGGGASEIQKNIIARRGLGLPRNF